MFYNSIDFYIYLEFKQRVFEKFRFENLGFIYWILVKGYFEQSIGLCIFEGEFYFDFLLLFFYGKVIDDYVCN